MDKLERPMAMEVEGKQKGKGKTQNTWEGESSFPPPSQP